MSNRQCQKSNQCLATGLRPLACGGYADYLIYSLWKTPVTELKQVISDYNQVKVKQHQQKQNVGTNSICLHVAKPLLQCEQGLCQAQVKHDPR
ncbi:MAG: hypothetical protein Q9M92_04120 [Enterobacterales bacterium]|nr:hypothetical protein [Enterobacterales bacterium]